MHELSICQALVSQVESIALENEAVRVARIRVQIGPLSGVEIPLLQRAYPLAAAGTVAEAAELELETMPIRVRCRNCQAETEASVNKLVCGECGDYRTQLLSGDEMVLTSVELDRSVH